MEEPGCCFGHHCLEGGYTTKTCKYCGDVQITDRTNALGHDYTNSNCCIHCGLGSASQGLSFTLSSDSEYYILSGIGTCTDVDIIVPSYYNSKPVKEIGEEAFKDDVTIRSVNVDIHLTKIGNSAFNGCSLLKAFTFTDSLIEIGDNAFRGCVAFEDFTFPSSIRSVGSNAFYDCDSLTTLNMPAEAYNLSNFGIMSLGGCDNLTTIFIPAGASRIPGGSTFYNDERITYVLYGGTEEEWNHMDFGIYNDNLKEAPYVVYNYTNEYHTNTNYSYLILDNKIEGIRSINPLIESFDFSVDFAGCEFGSFAPRAFENRARLSSVVLPNGMKKVPHTMFSGCSSLTSIAIPEGVTVMEQYAFNYSALESISLPSTLTAIRNHVFWGCGGLKNVVLPASLLSIGDSAFGYCGYGGLTLTFEGRVASIGAEAFNFANKVYVHDVDYDYYHEFNNSEWQSNIVQNNCLYIIENQ